MHTPSDKDWRAKYLRIKYRLKTTQEELQAARTDLAVAEAARIETAGQLQDIRGALRERVAAAYELPAGALRGDTIEELEEHARDLKRLGY